VQFEMVLRRQTGKQVTTGEPVFTKDAHELAGEVVDRFRRPQPHAQYRVVQQIERADMRLDALTISRRRDREIALRVQRTRQKITLRAACPSGQAARSPEYLQPCI
jgi:hypothetical protein